MNVLGNEKILLYAELLSESSPRKAMYRISVQELRGKAGFAISKSSGYQDKVVHVETYYRSSFSQARLFWRKKIDQKLNPDRPRVYKIIEAWERPASVSKKSKPTHSGGLEQPDLFELASPL